MGVSQGKHSVNRNGHEYWDMTDDGTPFCELCGCTDLSDESCNICPKSRLFELGVEASNLMMGTYDCENYCTYCWKVNPTYDTHEDDCILMNFVKTFISKKNLRI